MKIPKQRTVSILSFEISLWYLFCELSHLRQAIGFRESAPLLGVNIWNVMYHISSFLKGVTLWNRVILFRTEHNLGFDCYPWEAAGWKLWLDLVTLLERGVFTAIY